MSFDARSRERLEALGRQLPQKLPTPAAPAAPSTLETNEGQPGRHPLELERNPEQLFRELMQASADGTVPPHLLDRLRQLEANAKPTALAANQPPTTNSRAAPGAPSGGRPSPKSRRMQAPMGSRRVEGADAELYTAFQQLLLEDEALD